MSTASVLTTCQEDMDKAIHRLTESFKRLRTGRATTDLFENVKLDYYGTLTPVAQMSTVNVSDASTITIKPFEHKLLGEIEKAIQKANLGVSASNDGVAVRVAIPPLNEERRKGLAGEAKEFAEEAKIRARDARRDANKTLDGLMKDGASEDEIKGAKEDVNELLKKVEGQLEGLLKEKTEEIMAI